MQSRNRKENFVSLLFVSPFDHTNSNDDWSLDKQAHWSAGDGIQFINLYGADVIICELYSLQKIKAKQEAGSKLKKASFKSPTKTKNRPRNSHLGQIANFIEILINDGKGLEQVKQALLAVGMKPSEDAMDIDEEYAAISAKKRKKATAPYAEVQDDVEEDNDLLFLVILNVVVW